MIDHALLPSVHNARLPAAYERAKVQLAECAKVDECWEWADKAAALASYAKQSDDETLENLAVKIRARAVRRCGELLREIEPKRGANQNIGAGGDPKVTRKRAATNAGMSERQRKTALRVANVPEAEFEAAVEADKPARIPELAERGKKKKKKPVSAEFKAATAGQGAVRALVKIAASTTPAVVVRGLREAELLPTLAMAKTAHKWLDRLISQLERKLS